LVESGQLDFGEWVSEKLAYAIGTLNRYQYWPAKIAAKDALAPFGERASFSKVPTYSLDTLWRAFEVARAEPFRPFPQFGPIIHVG
jgi:hypothetical protein